MKTLFKKYCKFVAKTYDEDKFDFFCFAFLTIAIVGFTLVFSSVLISILFQHPLSMLLTLIAFVSLFFFFRFVIQLGRKYD